MSHAVYEMMNLNVVKFLNNPGKRFPVNLRLIAEETASLSEDVRFLEDIVVSGKAFAQLGTLYFDTQIKTVIERPCRRCLALVHLQVDLRESFEIVASPGVDAVDPLHRIVGFILASLDPHPLCRPDCRGLCPVCGANLNEHPDHTCSDADEEHHKLRDFLP